MLFCRNSILCKIPFVCTVCSLSVLELNTWVLCMCVRVYVVCVCVCGGGGVYARVCADIPLYVCVCVTPWTENGDVTTHTGDEVIIVLSVSSSLYNCCSKVFIVNNTSCGATNYPRRPVNAQRLSPSTPLLHSVCWNYAHAPVFSVMVRAPDLGIWCHMSSYTDHVMSCDLMWWSCEHTHSVCWRLHRYQLASHHCTPVLWRYQPQD